MADPTSTGRRPLTIARIIGVLERGGAQLSALRLSAALRSEGFDTRLYAGDATDEGIALAAAFDVPVETFARDAHLQWVPSTDFAAWLRPRLADADLVHAHMFGAWWAAAAAVPDGVPLVASEHNAMTWPYGDHVAQARAAAGRGFAESLGVPERRILEGRSIVDGFDARPLPGLPSLSVTFDERVHPEK